MKLLYNEGVDRILCSIILNIIPEETLYNY